MAHKISVRSGFQVNIPGVGEVDGPVTDMVISDQTFEALNPNSMHASDSTKPLIDRGFIDSSGDAVLTQGANVAAPAALTSSQNATANGSDAATTQALANSLKVSYNALQTDVVALRTTVANLLASITGPGKPMSS
jgi:hypothetical protein